MSTPPDDMTPAAAPRPTATAADGGWRRWMPRRRPAPGAEAPAAPEPAGDRPPPEGAPAAAGAPTPPDAADAGDVPTPEDAAVEPAPDPPAAPAAAPARRWLPRRRAAAPPAGGDAPDPGEDAAGEPVTAADAADGVGRLRRRRKRLLSEREVTVYHLGGLAFELYRHDLLQPEVMRKRAGEIALIDETVHDIDMRLEQLAADRRERRTRDRDPRTPVGNCVACRAPFQVDARFCWSCGARLAPELPDPPAGVAPDEQATQTIRRPEP